MFPITDTYINQNSKVKSANSSMDFCMNLTNNTWNSWSIENNGFHSEHISYFISRLCMAWLETNSTNLWYLGWHVVIVAVVIIATMLIPCIYHLNLGQIYTIWYISHKLVLKGMAFLSQKCPTYFFILGSYGTCFRRSFVALKMS